MRESIRPSLELIERLKNAQLRHASRMAADCAQRNYSDDDYDYLRTALRLAAYLVDLDHERDLEKFGELLNDTSERSVLMNCGCDGICHEIWATNAPSLAPDE
ncbi:hypothetical protein [Bradyrhizobium neotropicale]|uniref:Uncharacterized protein n=1 Tax=Bradyrhizobium neotropicale TaxID=1497615 RepID=A0A176YYP2_9BRAD|nr:hypothetical protein [Bradyrhizobium neotropicale]OAF11893.1 hypothetical protein AXW67_21630 [Bradyrhizobium neotropicale]